MIISHQIPASLACTLTFLLLVLYTPITTSQEISFTEEPQDSYYIVKKKPVTITCAARHAVDISFVCGGTKVPPTSVERDAFDEEDPEIIRASISVTRADVTSYRKKVDKYWCECQAISIDGQVAATSKRGSIANAVLRYRFKTQPSSQRVIDGDSVVLECVPPVSDPKPQIFWKKDNRRINLDADDRLVLSDTGSLLIDSAIGEDAGSYACVARSVAGRRESKKATLHVTVLQEATESETAVLKEEDASGAKSREERQSDNPFFSTEPKPVYYVKPNEELMVDCGVTSANIITFRCNGERKNRTKQTTSQGQDADGNRIIQSQLKVLHSEVVAFHRKNGDRVQYQCQCVGWYQRQRQQWKSIQSSKNLGVIKLAFLEETFKREPTNLIVGVNTQATLKCEPPKGQPSPWVYWYKDDVKIDPRNDDNYRVSREGNLVILSAQYSDMGRYRCVAENIVKQVKSGVAELRVSATAPPTTPPTTTMATTATTGISIPDNIGEGAVFLQDLPDEIQINAQGIAKVKCITIGAKMVSMECDERRLNQNEAKTTRETNERTGKMIITATAEVGAGDVRANPDGYWCRCTAWERNVVDKAWKRIDGNKGYIVEKIRDYIDEDFAYPPKDVEVEIGQQAEISCEPPSGSPMPQVFWLKDGDVVSPEQDSNFRVLQAGTLVIESARVEDDGEYICVAENKAGTRKSEPAILTVKDADASTDNCQLHRCKQIMTDSVDLTDPKQACENLMKVKQCLMDLQCSADMQETVDRTLQQVMQASAACDSVISETCQYEKCHQMATQSLSSQDTTQTCQSLTDVRQCLMSLECPSDIQAMIDTTLEQVEQAASMCGDVTTDTCQFERCQQMVAESMESSDQKESCEALVKVRECLLALQCSDEVQVMVDQTLEQVEQSSAMCATSSECIQDLNRCQKDFEGTPREGDQEAMCWALTDLITCVERIYCPELQSTLYKTISTAEDGMKRHCPEPDGPHPMFTAEPEPVNYITDSIRSVELHCTVVSADILMFVCNNSPLSHTVNSAVRTSQNGFDVMKNSLTITVDQVDDFQGSSPYSCVCKGLAWIDEIQTKSVIVESRPAVIQRAFIDPDFIEDPKFTGGPLGEMVTLTCIPPDGAPKPTVSWIRDGYHVRESDNVMLKEDGSLVIKAMTEGDVGVYSCSAMNFVGEMRSNSVKLGIETSGNMMSTSYPDMTTQVTLRPYVGQPFISKDLHSVYYVTKNTPVDIVCEVTGVKDVIFRCSGDVESTLTKSDTMKEVTLADGSTDMVTVVSGTITVSKEDVDQEDGYFTCTCVGVGEEGGVKSYIESQEAYVEFAFLKKRFASVPQSIDVHVGDFMSVTCLPPSGNPPPQVSWLKDGEPLQSIFPGGVLATESAKLEDAGEYQCVATNVAAKRISEPFLVEVADPDRKTPDGGMGTDQGETTTEETTVEVEEITSGVFLTTDTPDEETSLFNGFDTTKTMTSDPEEGGTTPYNEMSTSTTEEMMDSKSTMPTYSTEDDMTMNKEDSTQEMMDKTDTTDMRIVDSTTMSMKETTDEMFVETSSRPNLMSTSDRTDMAVPIHVTSENVHNTCQEVLDGCRLMRLLAETNNDMIPICKGPDSYLECMNNFLSGCSPVVDANIVAVATKDYEDTMERCKLSETCPRLEQCRYVYSESPNPEETFWPDFPLNHFCGHKHMFMECVQDGLVTCGVEAASDDSMGMATGEAQVAQWFDSYCDKFVQDSPLASCNNKTMCNLPIDLMAKDNASYWCRMMDSLHACTSVSVNDCQLTDLEPHLKDLEMMKDQMGCPTMGGEGGDGITTSGEEPEEGSTQRTVECDGEGCGAASIGVSVLVISLIQFAIAFFMAEQR